MVDYNIAIPSVAASGAMNPMALMQLQQRNALGQGRLDYMQQALELKQQSADLAAARANSGLAKTQADLAQTAKTNDVLSGFGATPAVVGRPGSSYSGTGMPNDPYAAIVPKLIQAGAPDVANTVLTGQKTAADTQGVNLANTQKAVENFRDLIRGATSEDEAISIMNKHKDVIESTGVPLDQAINNFKQHAAENGFSNAVLMSALGADKFANHVANLNKDYATAAGTEATTAKTQAQTAAIEAGKTGNTANERAFATLGQVLTNPSVASTPGYAQAYALASQPKPIGRINPQTGETEYTFVTPPLPQWVVPPTANAPVAAAPAAQPNTLAGAQATAVPAGGVANTLAQLQGAAPTNALVAPPAVAPTVAVRPEAPIVTKPSQKTTLDTATMAERDKAYPKATEAFNATTQSTDNLIQDLKDLRNHPGLDHITGAIMGTSLGGPNITGPARAAQALLDTIKSKGAFESLSQLRAASPTGGALGNVSDKEEQMLGNAFGTLQQNQNTEDFKKNVDKVIARLEQSKQNISNAYTDTYSYKGVTAPAPAAAATAPAATPTAKTETAPNTNSKGWVLHTDAKGNNAYVSPDGKQFEEVK